MALRGDLTDASPAQLLANLAESHASGCLAIDKATRTPGGEPVGEATATLHLRNGAVYAAALAGGTFLVGTRLVTSHALAAEALAEALEAQRTDLTGWRLGEILVHLGHIHADVVEKISTEQVLEIATEVCGWRGGSWKFRSGERTRAMLPHPLTVATVTQRVQARGAEWRELLPAVGGRHVPIVRTTATVPLSSPRELVALLRAADDHAEDAGLETCSHAAGLSLLEGARLVVSARAAGLLIPLPVEQRIAVGEWPGQGRRAPTGTSPTNLVLAPTPADEIAPARVISPVAASYALARLLELDGPRPSTQPAEAVAPEPLEAELSPEEIAADLQPDQTEHAGHEATVLDLNAARAARSAELAVIEEAATASALSEQLAREQSERDAEERAVADALRQVAAARAAAETAARLAQAAAAAEAEVAVVSALAGEPEAIVEPPAVVEAPAVVVEAAAVVEPLAEPTGVDEAGSEAVEPLEPPTARPAAFVTPVPAFTTAATVPTPLTAGERLGMFSATRDPMADTASLLRELSSLGDEEDAPAENQPVVRAPGAGGAAHAAKPAPDKKRKGLFGR